jgi:hypothetical protein
MGFRIRVGVTVKLKDWRVASENSVLGLLYVADQYTAGNLRVGGSWGQGREILWSGYDATGQGRGFRVRIKD